ncbi:MAG: HNH endonuclease signature motif containing protein [Aestuariivita sp.]|nr:HNH endonuclease signature motif containing protein [Aestuariivita sp.]
MAKPRNYDVYLKTRRWRNLRLQKLEMNPLCERCDVVTEAKVVHHRRAINDGGDPWDMDNLESLCQTCHNAIHNPPRPVNPERRKWLERMNRSAPIRQDVRTAKGFRT